MIVKEFYRVREDGTNLFRTYSNNNKMIVRNDGVEFVEAIDIEDSNYTYTESEKDIIPEEESNWHEITDEDAEEMQTAELEEVTE
jgi:hypothetical protein